MSETYIEETPGFTEALDKAAQAKVLADLDKAADDGMRLTIVVQHLVEKAGGTVRIPISEFVKYFGRYEQEVDGEDLVITTAKVRES